MAKLFNFSRKNDAQPVELVPLINRFARKSHKDRAYKRKYYNLASKIQGYEKYRGIKVMTNTFSYQQFEDFIFYLKSQNPYKSSTLMAFKSHLGKIIKIAQSDGARCDLSFIEFSLKKDESVSVYLLKDEIERVFNLKLKSDISLIRDRFIIGCCTGLRYSDYSRLTPENFTKEGISIKTQKTGEKVLLPVHWMIDEIINRNHGYLPRYDNSRQNFNKVIKTICKRAKITSPVLIERSEGNKLIKKNFKKYQLISSHTARRSFATNMYLAGIPTARIMMLTGHTTEQAFFKYIRIGKDENVKELKDHPFFKKS